jgi:hypothetical protein
MAGAAATMKSPVERAAEVYERTPCAYSFAVDLEFHLLHGFVFSRPDYFVMGRPVVAAATQALIVDHYRFPSGSCDCWHIWLAAGNLARMWGVLPWEMPRVSFQRGDELRFAALAAMRRLSTSPANAHISHPPEPRAHGLFASPAPTAAKRTEGADPAGRSASGD